VARGFEVRPDVWRELPDKYKFNHGMKRIEKTFPNTDYSVAGFEGIRAQDILPLLTRRFHFELFVGFANIVDILRRSSVWSQL